MPGRAVLPSGPMTKFQRIGVWALQILLAGFFVLQGVAKLTSSPAWVSRFRGWGYPDHFYLVVGLVEVLGGALLLVPRLVKFGASTLIVVMIGATATHVIGRERQVITTLVLIALLGIILYARRGTPVRK